MTLTPLAEDTRLPSRPLTGSATVTVDDPVGTRLGWLLVLRVVVISVLLASAVAVRATTNEELFARAAVAVYALAAAAYGTVLVGALVLRAWPTRAGVVAYSQLIADALLATSLVWLTGGHESVFAFIFSLSILNAAIVLGRQGALVLAAISSGLFLGVTVASAPNVREGVPAFLTNSASFFLVAVLAGYLTSQLTKASARLEDARQQIEQLEGLYEAVLGSLPSGVVSVGAGGTVNFVNTAGVDILGRTEVVGHSLRDLSAPLGALIEAPGNRRFEVELEVAGRGRRVVGGSVAPLVGRDDAGRVVVFQDLTELRRLQEDVARSERLAELGRLAAGLAHEIRNPLAAMIGCLQLLSSDGPSTGDNARLLGIVQREAERLSGLVQAFLTYARPAEPRRARVSLPLALADIVTSVSHGLTASRIRLLDIGDIDVCVDNDQLRQVLWNVLTNADRIGDSIGQRLDIEVSATIDGNEVIIAVDDSGPGVPEDLRQRIFEPFFTTRPDGNGLGLATSHQLVSQNGGVMGVLRSPTLGGARFTLRFPLHAKTERAA